jgi:DNA-binding protein H-NS
MLISTIVLFPQTPQAKALEEQTKKQRQNAAKRDAQKAAKAAAERERLSKLSQHKRQLERERIAAQYASGSGKPGKLSGGMKARVDENGALIWE